MENSKRNAMSRFEHTLWVQMVKLTDIILVTIPFSLCWCLYYTWHLKVPYYWRGNVAIVTLFALVYLFMTKVYDGLKVSLYQISEMIYSQVLAMLISDGLLYIVICILYRKFAVLWPGLLCIAGQSVLIVLWAVVAHTWYFQTFKGQPSAIIYFQREGMENLIETYGLAKKFDVKNTYTVEESLEHLEELNQFETLFLSGVHSHERNIILKYCVENDINMYVIPRVGDVLMSGAKQMHLFHLPMLRVGRYNPNIFYLGAKRFLDIVVSGLALVITSPILLITTIAVKCDGGPAFYKQERLTKDGKVFKVIKFRSMRVDAEKDGVARLSTGDKDDRITKVGHVIRKVRIDELPQLFNILCGENSIFVTTPNKSTKCCFA